VTILRQGKVAGEVDMPCPVDELVRLMFGRSLPPVECPIVEPGPPILQVKGVSVASYRLSVESIDLDVRAGEVVGLAGLEGSGQRLFMRACAGLERTSAGTIHVDGRDLTGAPYRRFLDAGVAYMPSSRLEEGLVRDVSIMEHFALADRGGPFFIDWQATQHRAEDRIETFNIIGRPDSPVESLSGGNQQRVLLALLPPDLRLLLMEHPTRGLDVESARWVWEQLLRRRELETAMIILSADLDEILDHADRVAVFFAGAMSAVYRTCDVTVEQLGFLIGGKAPVEA
jgi:simple sugar transport system ATP-binding protein